MSGDFHRNRFGHARTIQIPHGRTAQVVGNERRAAGMIAVIGMITTTGALQVPAPLVRVTEGSRIVASVRNDLTEPLRVHGFCARDGSACPALDVPPATACKIHFVAARAGTYHYWATSTGAPLPFRGGPDAQLSGAFIVDPVGATIANDRVMVLTEWTSLTRPQLKDLTSATDIGAAFRALDPQFTLLVNGLSWPATERLTYNLGERIHWRVVNLSSQFHPMHLHGSTSKPSRSAMASATRPSPPNSGSAW